MPKSTDKTKGAQKRRKAPSNSGGATGGSDAGEAGTPAKQKKKEKKKKTSLDDGIAMSKQLARKVKTVRSTRPTRSNAKESAPRVCGNGKPMPSLADLEKMYEDSDSDTDTEDKPTVPATSQTPERCTTPVGKITALPPEKLMSPTTLKKIASKIAPKVIDILETIDLDDDGPPHEGICPPKKRKKPDEPYIVGCKDRPMIDRPFRSRVGVGDTKYGVECHCDSDDEDEGCCKSKRCKRRGDGSKISKSRFNPKSEEIASHLKRNERQEKAIRDLQNVLRVGGSKSPDSCDTVDYEYTNNVSPTYTDNVSPSGSNTRPFSPLPSTSRDRETFLKNVQLFNESLVCDNDNSSSQSPNDVQIIEVPLETIVVDDAVRTPQPPIKAERYIEDDSCIFVDTGIKKKNISLIDLDEPKYDFYNNIDTLDLEHTYNNEDCEIIDVDDVIAQNTAVLKKYKKDESLDVVTFVDPNTTMPRPVQEAQNYLENEVLISSNMSAGTVRATHPSTSGITPNVPSANRQDAALSDGPLKNDSSSTIADVVTNFFSNPNPAPGNNSLETVDLTTSSFMNKVTSWMSSIENFIRGQGQPQQTPAVQRPNDSVIVINSPAHSVPVNSGLNRQNTTRNRQSRNAGMNRFGNIARPSNVVVNHAHVPPANNTVTVVTTHAPKSPEKSTPSGRTIECPICMDTLTTSIASTMCGHVFCMECIKSAIKANGKRCPTCRKKLTGAGYHQLFL